MPRINPAPTPPITSEKLASPVIKAPVAAPVLNQPVKPVTTNRPKHDDETPLLPEQAAFQLPESFVSDVQQVAIKTGYVGLTPGAIQRAYLQGEGLFVDLSA